ncbi:MAG: transglutaminase family protein [Caldilineaceae bacterium]
MVATIKLWVIVSALSSILSAVLLYLYTLPGLRRLPKERERSLNGITTIDDAVRDLRASGKSGWELVAAAQKLVNAKMVYSRRNGWDTPARAFRRGMGYCQQQASALLIILRKLGFDVQPVQALRCQFPAKQVHEYWEPGLISGHMWLVVTLDGVEKDVCPGHPENEPGKVHFTRLARRTNYGPLWQILGHIGSMIVNVQRDNAALKRQTAAGSQGG